MKAKLLLAFFAISSFAMAQDRGRSIQRQEGRQQNNSYNYSVYNKPAYDFYRLDLSYYQKNILIELLDAKEREAKLIRRRYANPKNQLANLERDYEFKISKILNRNQYSQWVRYYAAEYSVELHSYRYV